MGREDIPSRENGELQMPQSRRRMHTPGWLEQSKQEREWAQIVQSFMGHGKDLTYSLSEMGSQPGLWKNDMS